MALKASVCQTLAHKEITKAHRDQDPVAENVWTLDDVR